MKIHTDRKGYHDTCRCKSCRLDRKRAGRVIATRGRRLDRQMVQEGMDA